MTGKEKEICEIKVLTNEGINFELKRTIYKRPKGFIWLFRKPLKTTETLTFTVKESTLSVLDRLAGEQIKLNLDESAIKSDITVLAEARRLMHEHSYRMARILAIAVLGQRVQIQRQKAKRANRIIFPQRQPNPIAGISFKNQFRQ